MQVGKNAQEVVLTKEKSEMKTAEQPKNGSTEFSVVDPMLFGVSFNDVDVAFRGGTYAIRPTKSVNPQTGLHTHGVYCVQKLEILDGDFAGEIRTKAYYVGGLAGSVPKGSPPRVLLVPSVDGKNFVGGLTPEQVIALALGELAFEEEDFPNYEGSFLLQPKDRNMPLRQDSNYGQLVESIKRLYPVGKNGKPNEIAYGTTFPGVLENKGPDFATGYGFHMRLEGEEFKTLVAVSALGPIAPTAAAQPQTQTTQSVTQEVSNVTAVTASANGNGLTPDSVRSRIYQALMKGPQVKNVVITQLMNEGGGSQKEKDELVTILLAPGTWESDLWAQQADGKYALK